MPLVRHEIDSTSSAHPSAEVIAAYVDRRLAPPARAAVEEHLADCAECRREVEWVIGVLWRQRECTRLLQQVLPGFRIALAVLSNDGRRRVAPMGCL
ncbi:MAG TPA: zf-HC2 domain-containing protein [Gemmatimonadales bacterium]|nr:zf-HC2 domain-containing protein [Gemmatimonadales bacterium]